MDSPFIRSVIQKAFRCNDIIADEVICGCYTFTAKLNMTCLRRNPEWQSTETLQGSLGTGTAKCLWHAEINLLVPNEVANILRTTYIFALPRHKLFSMIKIWLSLFFIFLILLLLPEQMKAEFTGANVFNQWFWREIRCGQSYRWEQNIYLEKSIAAEGFRQHLRNMKIRSTW